MHEMAIAEGVLAVVLDVAAGRRVRGVQLRMGALQRVVPDSFRFCFELAAQDTPASDARVELRDVAARWRCDRCEAETEASGPPFRCHACGAFDVDVISGEEILVDAVELDDGWHYRPGQEGNDPVPAEASGSGPLGG